MEYLPTGSQRLEARLSSLLAGEQEHLGGILPDLVLLGPQRGDLLHLGICGRKG